MHKTNIHTDPRLGKDFIRLEADKHIGVDHRNEDQGVLTGCPRRLAGRALLQEEPSWASKQEIALKCRQASVLRIHYIQIASSER